MVYGGYPTHFSHGNIIKYCDRPFKSVEEMNETMINNWNNVVKDGDLVYHLGDFCFNGRAGFDCFDLIFKRLRGLIIFIKGNHDKVTWKKHRHKFYAHSECYREIEINGQDITLNHFAQRVWNKSHHGAWHLFGHSHSTLPDDPHSRSIDCGVDCHNYTPINFEQIKVIMEKKLWTPIDHHGKLHPDGELKLSPADYAKLERKRMFAQLKKEFET